MHHSLTSRMGRSLLCLLLVCYFAACIAERVFLPECGLTNEGNEFFVGFFRNRFGFVTEQERIDPVLWITTSESTPVNFTVSTIFGPLASGVAIRGEITYIDIPIGFVVVDSSLGTDLQFKGIRIKAENDRRIAVFGHHEEQASNDAYLGLPVVSLPAGRSYEYIAVSIQGDEGTAVQAKDSVALIIGTENNTEIIVELPFDPFDPLIITYNEANNSQFFPGTPVELRTITIQRFQTLYLQVRGGDISGVRIIANKPISVFSGHECADIPEDSAPCDVLIEQLQPVDTWGTEVVTVPLRTRSGDVLKVFASQDSTTVNITYTDISSGTFTTDSFTLARNGFRELGGTSTEDTGAISDFALIQSNNPIAVFQFSRSFTTDNVIVSDPFMLSVPSCEQYRDSYAVAPAPFNETTIGDVATRVAYVNYTNIAVPAEYFNASLITINNSPANESEFRPIKRADNSTWGYGAQLLLDEGAQVIRHQDPNATLSVTIYGFSNQQSWGTIGGTGLAPVALSVVSFNESTGGSGVPITVSEGAGTVEVILVLSKAVGQDVSVFVIATNGSARAGVDFGPSQNYTVTFPAGSTIQSVEIPIIDDDVFEFSEDFQFTLDVPEAAVRAGVIDGCDPFTAEGSVQIIDDDGPIMVMFNQTMYSVIESTGPAQPVLVLSNPSSIAFDVTVTSTDGSATGGVDYDNGTYIVTFPAGETIVPFDIPIIDDIVYEGNEDFMLTIDPSLPSYVSVGTPDEATVTIVDDDPITVMFNDTMYSVVEGAGPAQPVLVLSGPSSMTITVNVTSTDGSATGGDDYGSGPYIVTFLAGETIVPFDIPIINDVILEGDEDFMLTIDSSLPTDVSVGTPDQATVTIVDDDTITVMFNDTMYSVIESAGPARPVLVLSDPSSMNITVEVRNAGGNATSGEDYGPGIYTVVIPAGMTMVPFDIPIIDDVVLEGNEDFDIVIIPRSLPDGVTRGVPGRATVTIVDDDLIMVMFNQTMYSVSEGAGPAQPVLVLSGQSTMIITVNVTSTDGSATGGVDYGSGPYTVIFPAGETIVPFDIPITDDGILEGDEDFTLTIDPSSLPDDGTVVVGTPDEATVTIIDDDPITVMFSDTMYSVVEGAGPAQPVLVLSNPSATDFNVTVTSTDGSATGGDDYDPGPYIVTIPAGETIVPFNISIFDDMVLEGDENFTITIDPSLPTGVSVGTPDEATVTIVDDDPIMVMFNQTMYSVVESAGPAQPVLVLSNPSATPFDVTVTSTDGSATGGDDYDPGPYIVTIPAGETIVPFNISIFDDMVLEGDEDFTITIDPSLPTGVSVGTPDEATVTIVDDDPITVMFNDTMYSVVEGAGPAQPVLVLSNPSATDFNVTVTSTDGSATGGDDYDPGPYIVTFLAGETIVPFDIPIIDDIVYEDDEDFILTIDPSLPTDVSVGTPDEATVTIVDDDPITVMFNDTMYSVVEGAGPAQPVLVLSNPSATDFNVTVNSTDGSATGGDDYGSGPYIVTFLAGETIVPFDIPIIDDIVYEDDEDFILTIDPSLPTGVSVGTPDEATVTIVDDDPITVMFNQTMYSVIENAGPAQPVLVLSNPSSIEFNVTVTSTDGSATGGDDYDPGPYIVTFPAGETIVSFDIPIINDVIQERVEDFTITIDPSLPSYVSIGTPGEATVNIVDVGRINVMFEQPMYSVNESAGPAQPVLVLSGPSSTPFNVTVNSTDGSATGGVDYDSGPYIVTFPAGETRVSFDIPITDDDVYEGDESFTLTIDPSSLPDDVDVGSPGQATVTIVDDDPITVMFNETMYSVTESAGPAQPVLVLSNPSATSFDVTVTSTDGSATGGDDYDPGPYTVTIPAGETIVPFNISIIDDVILEGDEDFMITIDPSLPTGVSVGDPDEATVTIVDDDPITVMFSERTYSVVEDDGPAQPVLVLSNPSSTPFNVTVTSTDGSATGGVDYDSGPYIVTIPAEETIVPFNISIIDDRILEGDEDFMLTIDPSLPAGVSVGDPDEATVTIVDDDGITVMFGNRTYSVDEDSGPAQPVLVLSDPSSMNITVEVRDIGRTATSGEDYGPGIYTVVIPAGMTMAPFDIPIIDDDVLEGNEDFDIVIIQGSLPDGVTRGVPGRATVTIVDDDPITVMFNQTMYSVVEGAGPAQPVLVLSNPSATPFDVTVTSTDGSATGGDDYDPGPYIVTIPAGETIVPFDIPIIDDMILEGNENFTITIDPSLPTNVSVGTPDEATVTIVDDDVITVMFSEPMYSVDEDAGPAQPVLVLSNPSSMDIMVTVTDTEGSAIGGGVDYGSGPYIVTIPAGMTSVPFNISIIDDMILEGDENFTITIDPSLPTGVSVGTPGEATVIIMDDDTVTVRFANRTGSVSESDGFAILTVVREGDADIPVTVTVTTSDGTATAGDDYRSINTTVMIPANQTSVDVIVPLIDDNCREEDETFNGELTVAPGQPSVILGTPDETIITIVDDDVSTVQFINSPYFVDEDIGIYNVCLSITPACPVGATVTLVPEPKDADPGIDYDPAPTTVTFAPNQMIACVVMNNVIEDNVREGPECFSLVITVPPDSGLVPGDSANVTIIDGEPAVKVQFFNDTIIGDPLYEVPLNMISNETFPQVTSLCYEIHGEAGQIFNLISDGCVQVNANYSAMDIPENGNIISQIGVLAYDNASGCAFITVDVSDCVPVVNGVPYDNTVYDMNGVTARRRGNRARITVPNCAGENDDLVFWVVCQEISDQRMIKFQVMRGSALQPDSHGLLGQFWNIPVTATGPLDPPPANISNAYSVEVDPLQSPARTFVAELYRRTWERTLKPCLYAGNSQGGPISEVADDASVIEGEYFEYEVTDGIFGTSFTYNRLLPRPCPRQ